MPIIKRKDWPQELQNSWAMKGLFVGGCVERGDGSSFRAKAHAHISGRNKGWICVRKASRLADRELMIHELAHIITGHGHDDTFRAMVRKLGGTLDETDSLRSFHKKGLDSPDSL